MKAAFTYWKEDDGRYLGYLNDSPQPLDAEQGDYHGLLHT